MIKVVLVACFSVLISMNAISADVWTGNKKIKRVQIVQNGGFLLTFDSVIQPSCSIAGTSALYIYPDKGGITQEGIKSFLSTALMAFSTDLNVDVMYDDSTGYCWGKYLLVSK
ncbi:hypothetical protein [Teredinibacter sp. KSP-S5-2]|uniref:hypothetical protein n=1 Tax=Teredinibacter sp. KSP-S5-2 TaxID=3034506 RepID=UPI0029351B41|nr:hypothetical protein [Teredinibacter sp. KSP-S5-2]WNO08670.1 hypothetical protein P5V12_16995 [Teredinibacter sp. KSP-S5-2]